MVKLVKNVLRGIRAELLWWAFFFKSLWQIRNDKIVFLVMTPRHGNLGDQAIALSEYKFLNDITKGKYVIELYNNIVLKHLYLTKKVIRNKTILIHGGGFVGTLWMEEELRFRKIVTEFPLNRIIIFPQSVYFENTKWGEQIKQETTEIINAHNNLFLCTREKESFNICKQLFSEKNVLLVPDMVAYLGALSNSGKRSGVLFCIRRDHEKVVTEEDLKKLEQGIQQFLPSESIEYTDTFIYKYITPKKREKEVYKKITEFSKARLVITDRLHGMVFAAIAGTPCIALGNCNYKIKGVYDWIKINKYIAYIENLDSYMETLEYILSIKNCMYRNSELLCSYKKLKELLDK